MEGSKEGREYEMEKKRNKVVRELTKKEKKTQLIKGGRKCGKREQI